jgi:hypothetical protein
MQGSAGEENIQCCAIINSVGVNGITSSSRCDNI